MLEDKWYFMKKLNRDLMLSVNKWIKENPWRNKVVNKIDWAKNNQNRRI
jgi:hypothetical protein